MNRLVPGLESILPLVTRPSRYTDHELNVHPKGRHDVRARAVLVYPDVYEIGMSHLGLRILYHVVNRTTHFSAERAFAPWVDLEARLRSSALPLASLETRTPLRDFDLVGFTLPSELTYTNILNVLNLGAVPLRSEERTERDPLVIAGGPCASAPEPLAPFLDAFAIGDGEEVLLEILELVGRWREGAWSRAGLLTELARLPGVYVPSCHEAGQGGGGGFSTDRRGAGNGTWPVRRRFLSRLRDEDFPVSAIVPYCEIEHDRLTVEVMRGCGRGCRFCHAGMHYRPVRWRSAESVVRLAREGIRRTGWEEVSLLSLSATDYPFLGEVVDRLNAAFYEKRVAVSLPSLRAEGFSEELAGALKKVRKAGLTFAPEAGTDRLRRVINKPLNEEELLRTIRTVYGNGWGLVKLYFMVGLPTEREEDLKGIAGLADRIGRIAGGKGVKLNVSPFVPKPHTPFQWDGQDSLDSLEDKLSLVRGLVRRKNVRVKSHDPRASKIEAILARGDRRLSGAVERAWRLGCRFDEWSEHFRFDLWKQALQEEGFGLEEYAGPRDLEAALPWDHIDLGILPGFLKEEWRRARSGELTRGCPAEVCESCGVCPSPGISPAAAEAVGGTAPASWREGVDEDFGRRKRRLLNTPSLVRTRFRVQYRKGPEVRFLSHLDLMRALTRAFRRADLPLAFSEGFSPHPRVAFGPPLTLGFVSRAEFLDLQLSRPPEGPLPGIVNPVLPAGLWILESRPILRKTDSLSSVVNTAAYECLVPGPSLSGSINSFLSRGEVRIVRKQGDRQREVDIRPLVLSLRELAGGGGIEMLLRAGGAEGVNPREVLREVTGLPEEGILGLLIERVGLFVERQGKLVSPMELI